MTQSKKTTVATAPKPLKKLVPRPAETASAASKEAKVPAATAKARVGAPEAGKPAAVATPASTENKTPVKQVEAKPAAAASAAAAPAPASKARAPRKPTREDETLARHQKSLADALEKAQAIKYEQPKVMRQEVVSEKKPVKAKKVKLVRDSYAMPEAEHQQIAVLKKRLAAKGVEVKKSELLRAGVAVLTALNDAELKAVMSHIERIKTGRPSKASKK